MRNQTDPDPARFPYTTSGTLVASRPDLRSAHQPRQRAVLASAPRAEHQSGSDPTHGPLTTDAALAFPREMCFGIGFFLSDGASAPVCLNGAWRER